MTDYEWTTVHVSVLHCYALFLKLIFTVIAHRGVSNPDTQACDGMWYHTQGHKWVELAYSQLLHQGQTTFGPSYMHVLSVLDVISNMDDNYYA